MIDFANGIAPSCAVFVPLGVWVMDSISYLLFTLGGADYGLAAEAVQEMFLLPALASVPEVGPEVVGILNLRGQLLPVIDLQVCLGYSRQPNDLSQAVIVVRCGDQTLGLVVDQIQQVEAIAPSSITLALETPYLGQAEVPLVVGLTRREDTVVVLLDPMGLGQGCPDLSVAPLGQTDQFMAQFSPADRQVLQLRAAGLTQQLIDESTSTQTALAVVGLDGEHFALGLETVHEFTEVSQITPIPCCPPHIVGNMNLRGEVLTLVDVRHCLNLSPAAGASAQKAVVMRLGSLVAGVLIDEVFDVVYVDASEVAVMPTAAHANAIPYLRGVARYGDSVMSLLDLPKLLTQGQLVVDQSNDQEMKN